MTFSIVLIICRDLNATLLLAPPHRATLFAQQPSVIPRARDFFSPAHRTVKQTIAAF